MTRFASSSFLITCVTVGCVLLSCNATRARLKSSALHNGASPKEQEPAPEDTALPDPVAFASLGRKHAMIYVDAVRTFGKQDVPRIRRLLSQGEHQEQWRFLAQLLGFVSERGDQVSIDVLLRYFQRTDVWPEVKQDRLKSFDVGMGKILCLEWIGMVGGKHAENILLHALTPKGAEELAREWIHYTEISYPGGKEHAIASIHGRAAIGLVYCQSKKGIKEIEKIYEQEKDKCIHNGERFSHFLNEMVSAMAQRAFVDEHGLQRRYELYGNNEYLEIIAPYLQRYWIPPIQGAENNAEHANGARRPKGRSSLAALSHSAS